MVICEFKTLLYSFQASSQVGNLNRVKSTKVRIQDCLPKGHSCDGFWRQNTTGHNRYGVGTRLLSYGAYSGPKRLYENEDATSLSPLSWALKPERSILVFMWLWGPRQMEVGPNYCSQNAGKLRRDPSCNLTHGIGTPIYGEAPLQSFFLVSPKDRDLIQGP